MSSNLIYKISLDSIKEQILTQIQKSFWWTKEKFLWVLSFPHLFYFFSCFLCENKLFFFLTVKNAVLRSTVWGKRDYWQTNFSGKLRQWSISWQRLKSWPLLHAFLRRSEKRSPSSQSYTGRERKSKITKIWKLNAQH